MYTNSIVRSMQDTFFVSSSEEETIVKKIGRTKRLFRNDILTFALRPITKNCYDIIYMTEN